MAPSKISSGQLSSKEASAGFGLETPRLMAPPPSEAPACQINSGGFECAMRVSTWPKLAGQLPQPLGWQPIYNYATQYVISCHHTRQRHKILIANSPAQQHTALDMESTCGCPPHGRYDRPSVHTDFV
jgi:hypothetical protein